MNHRFLLRLVTNVAVCLLTLSCFGIVLWVIDEFLGWDILPDAISLIVRALLVAGGVIAFVLVVMNALLSLALLAEANASRAGLPNYGVSARVKRRVRQSIVAGVVAIALIIGGLQLTDHVRAQAATRASEVKFMQAQADLDVAVNEALNLFTPSLLEALSTNTLAEKGQLGNMSKLFNAIQSSFPHSPSTVVLTPASQQPFRYSRITINSIGSNSDGKTILSPDFYTNFPSEKETQVIEQLFAGELPSMVEPLEGRIINNTVPSSWGVLKQEDRVIAIVYLYSDLFPGFNPYDNRRSSFHHDGPDNLFANT